MALNISAKTWDGGPRGARVKRETRARRFECIPHSLPHREKRCRETEDGGKRQESRNACIGEMRDRESRSDFKRRDTQYNAKVLQQTQSGAQSPTKRKESNLRSRVTDSKRQRFVLDNPRNGGEAEKENQEENQAPLSGLINLNVLPKNVQVKLVEEARCVGLEEFFFKEMPVSKLRVKGTKREDVAFLLLQEELGRSRCLDRLRVEHSTLISTLVGIPAPKMSLNRWLLERQLPIKATNVDPLLPEMCDPVVSPSLVRELLEAVPIKVNMHPKTDEQAKASLLSYIQACIRVTNDSTRPAAVELDQSQREQILKLSTNALTWMAQRASESQISCEVMEKLKELKNSCSAPLQRKMRPVIEDVCQRLAHFADSQAKLLKGEVDKLRVWVTANGLGQERMLHKLVSVNSGPTPLQQIEVAFCGLKLPIQESHYKKLNELYRHWLGERGFSQSEFNINLACLLLRYHTFFGYEGAGLNYAVPPAAFDVLTTEFGVEMECFASPLDCYYPQFCSPFPDTDHVFGSCGSFFNFHPTSGSFEAHPPFTEELLLAMIDHMEGLLTNTTAPLSFIVFVSDWRDSEGVIRMMNSPFLRNEFVLEARRHIYIDGAQSTISSTERSFVAVHPSHVFFLQNEAAFAKWTPTAERNQLLRLAMSRKAI